MLAFFTTLLLFFMLLLIWIFVLARNQFDIISPSSIVNVMTILFTLILLVESSKYNFSISLNTILIIVLSVLSFSTFSIFYDKGPNIPKKISLYFIPNWLILFTLIFISISTFLYYKEVLKISTLFGYSNASNLKMLYYYRTATLQGGQEFESQSNLVGQLVIASYSLAYLNLVDFTKKIITKIKIDKYFVFQIIIILLYLIQTILSGGRTQFLYFIESFIFSLIFFYKQEKGRNIDFSLIQKLIPIIIIIGSCFYFLGSLTGKTNKLNFDATLFAYTGSSFVAFDKLVNNQISFDNNYFGSNVFIGIISLINKLGFSLNINNIVLPFVDIDGIRTNIYGGFGRYYFDFGILGLMVIFIFIGTLYNMFYIKFSNSESRYRDFYLLIFLFIIKTIFDFPIEERFFTSVLSLGTFLRIFYLIIFYFISKVNFVFGKRGRNENLYRSTLK